MGNSRTRIVVDLISLGLPALFVWFAFAPLNGWPQNDDPYYGRPVQWLVEEGRLQLALQKGELSATTVAHVLVGAVSSAVLGVEYRSLFLACIVQHWLGAAAVYGTLRITGVSRLLSLIGGFAFAFQPVLFGNCFTFMTDTPGASWVAIACFLSTLAFVRANPGWLLVCSLAVAWGFWIRQTNFLALGAPLATLAVLKLGGRLPFSLLRAAALLMTPALLSLGLNETEWLVQSTAERVAGVSSEVSGAERLRQMAVSAYGMCLNVGLFGLPLVGPLAGRLREALSQLAVRQRRVCVLLMAATGLLLAAPLVASSGGVCLTNVTGFYIQNGHAGPIFLADMDEPGRWGQLDGVAWPLWVWQLATVVVIAVDVLMVGAVSQLVMTWWTERFGRDVPSSSALRAGGEPTRAEANHSREKEQHVVTAAVALGLLAMAAASGCILLAVIDPLVDRYLLVLLAPLIAGLVMTIDRSGYRPAKSAVCSSVGILVALFVLNVVYVHDMLSWNDVRWQQVKAWQAAGWPATRYDGGRDVNAWMRLAEDPESRDREGDESKWWNGFAEYCIAAGPRPGWELTRQLPWQAWATGRTHSLYVLKKQDQSRHPAE